MIKDDLVSQIHYRLNTNINHSYIKKKDIKTVIDELVDAINNLPVGEKLSLRNFGTFEWRDMPPRKFTDIKTRKRMVSEGKCVLKFKAVERK